MKIDYPLHILAVVLGVWAGWVACAAKADAASLPVPTETARLFTRTMDLAASPLSAACQVGDSAGYIELDARTFHAARGRVGEKMEVGTVHVKAVDMPAEVTISPSSAVEGIYTTDVTTLPAGTSETDVTIYYEAKQIGKDEGRLYFMVGEDIYEQINLKGLAIDPATPPAVELEPASFSPLTTEILKPVSDTLTVRLVGLPSSVTVSVKQDQPGFTCNTGLLYYSVKEHQLIVTFMPKSVGDYTATVTLANEFIDPVVLELHGTALPGEIVDTEVEGDPLKLTYDHPVKLLNETFDSGLHNKPLSLERWLNVAAIGSRAWWGYTFPDYDEENAGESVAKVTPYDSKVELGHESECQMLLITPPLDYQQAESKMFTFRVMGKNMIEGSSDFFMFCNLVVDEGQLWALPVEGVEMPASPDQNGEWIDYHVDLSHLDLGDVFHMGFLFAGQRGTVSSTQYFVDDVSFGRTDLPLITPSQTDVAMQVSSASGARSGEIKVETANLTEPVRLTLGGTHMEKFKLSASSLPQEGGSFHVTLQADAEGTYVANVKLTSRGAATRYVSFVATVQTGIQTLLTDAADVVEVVDASGRLLRKVSGATVSGALQTLPGGTYVVRISGAAGTRTVKIVK